MASKTYSRAMNLVLHQNEDGSYVCYYDGVFGTYSMSDTREDAIAMTQARLEKAKEEAKKYGLPLVIGSEPLPTEDVTCFCAFFVNDSYKRISEEAIDQGVSVNTYLEEIIDGKHDYEVYTLEEEDVITLIFQQKKEDNHDSMI